MWFLQRRERWSQWSTSPWKTNPFLMAAISYHSLLLILDPDPDVSPSSKGSECQMLAANFNLTATTVVDCSPPYQWWNPQLDRLDFQPTNCPKIRLQRQSRLDRPHPDSVRCSPSRLGSHRSPLLLSIPSICAHPHDSLTSLTIFPSPPDESLLPRSSPGLGVVQGFGSSHLNLEADFGISLSAGWLLQRGRGQRCVSFSRRQSYAFSHWAAA